MKIFIQAIAAVILFMQCSPAKMALSKNEWTTKQEFQVNGKRGLFTKERMSFGDFQTTEVKRSWIKGTNSRFGLANGNVTNYDYTNIISMDYIKRKQTIRFSLTDGERQSETYCVSNFRSEELTIGNNPNSALNIGIDIFKTIMEQPDSKYYVQIYTAPHQKPWQLLLDNVQSALKPKTYTGVLAKDKDNYFTMVPVRHMENQKGEAGSILFGLVGFEFRDKTGKPLAAVSLIDKGTVYFQDTSNDEKFVLANACAALLMQEVID